MWIEIHCLHHEGGDGLGGLCTDYNVDVQHRKRWDLDCILWEASGGYCLKDDRSPFSLHSLYTHFPPCTHLLVFLTPFPHGLGFSTEQCFESKLTLVLFPVIPLLLLSLNSLHCTPHSWRSYQRLIDIRIHAHRSTLIPRLYETDSQQQSFGIIKQRIVQPQNYPSFRFQH